MIVKNLIGNTVVRVGMILLFYFAVVATFESVSGLEKKDIQVWYEESIKPMLFGTIVVTAKQQEQATLEDRDWSQYPSVEVTATGYTAGIESTGKTTSNPGYGITYSGVRVKRDLYSTIAADLRIFPIGTILWIPDYGYGVVADKGGAIKGNSLDLYYETVKDVYEQWGKRKVTVYVVKKGDGKVTEEQLRALNEDEAVQVFRQQYIRSGQ